MFKVTVVLGGQGRGVIVYQIPNPAPDTRQLNELVTFIKRMSTLNQTHGLTHQRFEYRSHNVW